VLILAYLPHVRPDVLDVFFIQNRALERRFTEFGGVAGTSHGGFLPTGETALFLLAGEDLEARLRHRVLFHPEHPFTAANVLRLEARHPEEPPLSAALQLTAETVERLTTGRPYHPPYSAEFPAQRVTTPYEWEDLVLDEPARVEVEDILAWMRHQETLLRGWGLEFDHAQHQDWILFFDEADSLFGKRTDAGDANDRAANQQISYLLQRIEDFRGVVILATNLRTNMDAAFARRFQSVVYFAMPDAEQRLRLWEDHFRGKPYRLAADVDLPKLARDYELAGGSILNVLRYACLKAVTRKPREVREVDLLHGIRRELQKEGKFMGAVRA
jgi:hypothetical protein